MNAYIIDATIVMLFGILVSGVVIVVSNGRRRWYFSHYRDITSRPMSDPVRQALEGWTRVGYWSGKIQFYLSLLMLSAVVTIVISSYIK